MIDYWIGERVENKYLKWTGIYIWNILMFWLSVWFVFELKEDISWKIISIIIISIIFYNFIKCTK